MIGVFLEENKWQKRKYRGYDSPLHYFAINLKREITRKQLAKEDSRYALH